MQSAKFKLKTQNFLGYRPTWAEINLKNLAANYIALKNTVGPYVKVMVTIKADAYGHGIIPVAKELVASGVDYLGVASIDEGIVLRKAGIKAPILVLGAILKSDTAPIFKYALTATVFDRELARALSREGRRQKKVCRVHLKVDTGMGRIGVLHYDAFKSIKEINRLRFIDIEGIFTHFAFADMNREFTFYQIDIFDALVNRLVRNGIAIPMLHAANSLGILDYKNSHFNMVRPGIVIYGIYPKDKIKIKLKPVLALKTKVVAVRRVAKGQGVSYGHEYVTKKDATLVTLPIGYGDGYPRNLSNKAPVLIKGKRFKISGRICMDQIMVDVGNVKVKTGDEAVLIGSQGKEHIGAEELANLSGTIPYEIVCGLGSRIPRLYNT